MEAATIMADNDETNPWRSLDALLAAYDEGSINDLDLVSATTGLVDIVEPSVILERLPKHLRVEFLARVRGILEANLKIHNVVTGEPLPQEAHQRLAAWMDRRLLGL